MQVPDRGLGQRDDAGLVPFPGERHPPWRGEAETGEREIGDLADAGCGVVEEDEQHPVPPRLSRSWPARQMGLEALVTDPCRSVRPNPPCGGYLGLMAARRAQERVYESRRRFSLALSRSSG